MKIEKEDVMERILKQVGIEIKPAQFGLIGKIFGLETSGFDVSVVLPSETQFDAYKSKHSDCEIFLDARHNPQTKTPNKSIYSYFKKLRVNPDKLSLEDNSLFFEKQGVCAYIREYPSAGGDDIPF